MDSLTMNRISGTAKETARRPLLGLTILLVEDSRFCSEAVRLMCLKSGARLRRADCLAAAYRHLATYRPSLVLVDLGLPDGSGLEIIRKLAAMRPNAPVVLATSGDDPTLARPEALKAGAEGYMPKPVKSVREFQATVLGCFPERQSAASEKIVAFHPEIKPDELAVAEDLFHLGGLLKTAVANGDQEALRYCAQFLHSVAEASGDPVLKTMSVELFACQLSKGGMIVPIIRALDKFAKRADPIAAI